MAFYAYMLASQRNGTLYIGSTDSLIKRMYEHRDKVRQGFTAKYGVDLLVWYEAFETREGAFRRERRMKKWNRAWKIQLIERFNPGWRDLYDSLL
ncbi:MAG TPA: GIY-YIG nuclease family protein [Caulobacteraceae bacterium]|nr:GIY-YIG nuclease family protein [Caulobacteraceae bacterium]